MISNLFSSSYKQQKGKYLVLILIKSLPETTQTSLRMRKLSFSNSQKLPERDSLRPYKIENSATQAKISSVLDQEKGQELPPFI